MANVPEGTLRDWNDGETVTSADYEQALEILRTAINSTDSDVSVLKNASQGVLKGVPYGSTFPSNPAVGDIFYRNDLDILYVMDEPLGWVALGKAGHYNSTDDPHQSYAQAVMWAQSFGLGTVSKMFTGDLNTLKTTGFYYSGTGGTNRPAGNGYCIVQSNDLDQFNSQIYIDAGDGRMYYRICNSGNWQQWRTSWDNVNLPENDLVRARETITTAEDINWKYTNGVYRVTDGGSLHISFPAGIYRYGTLICTKMGEAKTQMYFEHNRGRLFVRNAWGNDSGQSWTGWNEIVRTLQEDEINATLINGWQNAYADQKARYWKDSFGIVHINGRIMLGTRTDGTTVFTLPAGYRPKETYYVHSREINVTILTTGEVKIYNCISNADNGLDNIHFKAYN